MIYNWHAVETAVFVYVFCLKQLLKRILDQVDDEDAIEVLDSESEEELAREAQAASGDPGTKKSTPPNSSKLKGEMDSIDKIMAAAVETLDAEHTVENTGDGGEDNDANKKEETVETSDVDANCETETEKGGDSGSGKDVDNVGNRTEEMSGETETDGKEKESEPGNSEKSGTQDGVDWVENLSLETEIAMGKVPLWLGEPRCVG